MSQQFAPTCPSLLLGSLLAALGLAISDAYLVIDVSRLDLEYHGQRVIKTSQLTRGSQCIRLLCPFTIDS
ncbi:hypothetical protein BDV98DRAFT_575236 [Pterulicium gracile]|uniref:Uncharacterized protein n=1 Tax=Pterulicium gracile TaxID=1884261 RepID=A0A5C3Q4E9_9AGAR|nr:hypothetical protein BDV98DRAFT_575236 [Pterula gracilis]